MIENLKVTLWIFQTWFVADMAAAGRKPISRKYFKQYEQDACQQMDSAGVLQNAGICTSWRHPLYSMHVNRKGTVRMSGMRFLALAFLLKQFPSDELPMSW